MVDPVHLPHLPRARAAGIRGRHGDVTRWRSNSGAPRDVPLIVVFAVFFLGIIVPTLALTVRRLHDAGYSGLFALLLLIPYLGSLIIMIFALLPSSPAGAIYDPRQEFPASQAPSP